MPEMKPSERFKAVDYIVGEEREKVLSPIKKRALKATFELKAQAFLDRLAKETHAADIASVDYGKLVNAAIGRYYGDMDPEMYESHYEPLSKRESHSAEGIEESLRDSHRDALAELTAYFFSFTRTRHEEYPEPLMHDYISGSFLRQSTTVEQALAAKHALEAPKELGWEEGPKQILVAGVGMSGIRMIDSWKERKGELHLVDTDPFVASVLRNYARINGSQNVVVHDKDITHLDLPAGSFDHIRFSYCLKYMKTAGTDRLALLSAHSLLKEGGQLTIHEMGGHIDEDVVDRLVGMGMRVDTEQLATSPMRLVALKLAKGEKGKVMPWRNKGIRVIHDEPA